MAMADPAALIQKVVPLPLISLLVATGMYILNDLVDADLDRANGKKRPIPSGRVSKKQAWFFVISTNGLAAALSVVTLNPATMLILLPMLAIGAMYSAPRIALMNRFVVKTLAISTFYALCALLGMTSSYGVELVLGNPVVPIYAMAVLGIMIFVSSTLNDLGDIAGDKAAGRRTLPIAMGALPTIKLLQVLALAAVGLSLVLYSTIGIILVLFVGLFAAIVISRLQKIGKGIERMDTEAIRTQHKKIFPLHMLLQLLLAAGVLTL
jgi:4-hydroxybenzoate polyprenyltransferase